MQGYYESLAGRWGGRAQLAWDTIAMKPVRGIPAWVVHVMDVPFVEEATGRSPGDFAADPETVYLEFQQLAGACFIDQYIRTFMEGLHHYREHGRGEA